MRRDLVTAAACLVALLVVSVLGAQKAAPSKDATRSSTDYAFGGYRAFYELLAREGVPVERFRAEHDTLDDDTDTLVAAFPAGVFGAYWNDAERAAVQQWVRGGGRLIDIGETPPTAHEDPRAETVVGTDTAGDRGPLHGTWAAEVRSLPDRGTVRIIIQSGKHAETLLADRAGILVARYRLGRGDVIAVSNASWFENRNLGRGDNARLAYLAAQPRHRGGSVAFDEAIRGDIAAKPWYLALDVPERVGLALLALAGLAWLAYGFLPLGPPVRLRPPREPTSREFLDAVAALYARARARDHARDALLADARRSLERAPQTPESRALQAQADAAANRPVPNDAALVGLALLARTAREEIIRAGRNAAPNRRRTPARRAGAGDRWG
jgi:hypothetical protein